MAERKIDYVIGVRDTAQSALRAIKQAFMELKKESSATGKELDSVGDKTKKAAGGLDGAANSAKGLNTALRAIGWIGVAFAIFEVGKSLYQNLIKPMLEAKRVAAELMTSFNIDKIGKGAEKLIEQAKEDRYIKETTADEDGELLRLNQIKKNEVEIEKMSLELKKKLAEIRAKGLDAETEKKEILLETDKRELEIINAKIKAQEKEINNENNLLKVYIARRTGFLQDKGNQNLMSQNEVAKLEYEKSSKKYESGIKNGVNGDKLADLKKDMDDWEKIYQSTKKIYDVIIEIAREYDAQANEKVKNLTTLSSELDKLKNQKEITKDINDLELKSLQNEKLKNIEAEKYNNIINGRYGVNSPESRALGIPVLGLKEGGGLGSKGQLGIVGRRGMLTSDLPLEEQLAIFRNRGGNDFRSQEKGEARFRKSLEKNANNLQRYIKNFGFNTKDRKSVV